VSSDSSLVELADDAEFDIRDVGDGFEQ